MIESTDGNEQRSEDRSVRFGGAAATVFSFLSFLLEVVRRSVVRAGGHIIPAGRARESEQLLSG